MANPGLTPGGEHGDALPRAYTRGSPSAVISLPLRRNRRRVARPAAAAHASRISPGSGTGVNWNVSTPLLAAAVGVPRNAPVNVNRLVTSGPGTPAGNKMVVKVPAVYVTGLPGGVADTAGTRFTTNRLAELKADRSKPPFGDVSRSLSMPGAGELVPGLYLKL